MSHTPGDDTPPPPAGDPSGDTLAWAGGDWRRLSPRARGLFIAGGFLGWLLPALGAMVPIGFVLPWEAAKVPLAVALLLVLPATGAWLGARRWSHAWWRLDRDGFALRRGRFWEVDTRVPATRVQHVDLRRGPLERRFGLATLVVHTAGTRHSAVSVSGLAAGDATRLRDHLARQADDDDDDA